MFRRLRLVTPGQDATDRETLFLGRYGRLYDEAFALTRNREEAEDLVQDAFVQFVLARTPLDDIRNIDGYLAATVHHMHVSRVRRALRAPETALDLVDYDSAELAVRGADAARRLQVDDELRVICEYACARRLSSKSGTVLLLRFFHGYYIREIAQILNTPAAAVDVFLHDARREARSALQGAAGRVKRAPDRGEPARLVPNEQGRTARPTMASSALDTRQECLDRLRGDIFALAHEQCFPADWFRRVYSGRAEPLSCSEAAELVTCPHCLDAANRILGLPLLAERYPTDMLGPDRRSGPPDASSGAGTAGSGRVARMRRAVTDVYEHKPRELSVAVNGFVVASQNVGSAMSEQTISITTGEPIGFVEVFSEQQVRLLFLDVTPPPDGSVQHGAAIELSEGRSVRLGLDFSHTWPSIHVAYSDRSWEATPNAQEHEAKDPDAVRASEPNEPRATATEQRPARLPARARLQGWWPRLAPATAVVAMLAALGWYLFMRAPALSASELIDRAVAAERSTAPSPSAIEHRVWQIEERRADDGAVIGRARVEMWQQPNGERARRVFDTDTGALRALELRAAADGDYTVYRPGASPEHIAAGDLQTLERGDAWRIDMSAAAFAKVVGSLAEARVEQTDSTYVIRYEAAAPRSAIVRAVLTILKKGLRPVAQVLLVRRPEGLREYRFAERSIETLPASLENDRVFEPDRIFGAIGEEPSRPVPASSAAPAALTADAIAALEIEAFYLLNQASATLGEQVSVSASRTGVRIEGVLDTASRRAQLLDALAPLRPNAAVTIDLRTARQVTGPRARPQGQATVRGVEAPHGEVAAASDVRRYFMEHADPSWPADPAARSERVEREVLNFGARALERSRLALDRAWALEHLVTLVPPDAVSTLDAATAEKWRSMIRDHARAFLDNTSNLRMALAPVFAGSAGRPSPEAGHPGARVDDAVHELLALAIAEDEGIRSAFAVTVGEATTSPSLSSARFWDTVFRAESLAKGLAGVR